MRVRRLIALSLSVSMALSPVLSTVAPGVALASGWSGPAGDLTPYPGIIGGPVIIVGGGSYSPPTSPADYVLTPGKITVGTIVYKQGEAVPFVIGSDEKITFSLTVGGWAAAGTKVNKVALFQEGQGDTDGELWSQSLLADGATKTLSLEVKGSQITHTGKLYLVAYGDYQLFGQFAGTFANARYDLPFNVLERDASGEGGLPKSFDLGSETAKFTFPDGLDFISGTDIYFGKGLIPFNYKVEKDGTHTATINVTDATLRLIDELGGVKSPDGLSALDRAKQDYSKLTGGGSGGFGTKPFKPTWKIAAIYRWNKQIPKKQAGSLAFAFGLRGGLTASYLIFTGDLDFTGMLGLRGSFGIDAQGDSTALMGPTGFLQLRLGVGLGRSYIGRIGAYGDGKLDAWYIMLPGEKAGWESVTLRGELGLEAVFLGKRIFEWAILKGGPWHIVEPRNPGLVTANAQALLGGTVPVGGFGASDATVLDEDVSRSYLQANSPWLGDEQVLAEAPHTLSTAAEGNETSGLPTAMVSPRVLQENSYPDAQVRVAETPSGKIMLWLADDPTRDDANRTRLMWSRHDAATDSWSEPTPVDDDGTADFDPSLFVDSSGTAHAAWLDADGPLAQGLDVTQTAERMGVSYAALPDGASAFGQAEMVAEAQDGVVKTSPQLAACAGEVTVGWATLESQHLLDLGGTQDVVVASRNADGWTRRNVVQGTSGVITSLEAGVVDGQAQVAWTENASSNLEDNTNSTLTAVGTQDKEPVLIASGNVSCVQFVTRDDREVITWKRTASPALTTQSEDDENTEGNDALCCTSSPGGATETVLDGVDLPNSYQLDGDLSDGAIMSYAALSDGAARLFGRSLDSKGLNEENVLVEHADNITSWDVTGVDDDTTVAFAAESGVGTGDGAATLCVASTDALYRIQLDSAFVEGDQVPGGQVELVADVRNTGTLNLEGCTMKLIDGEGSVFATASTEKTMAPGETVEARTPFTLPDDFSYDPDRTILAKACFYGAAGAAGSSDLNVPLTGSARLHIEAYDWPYGEHEVVGFVLRNAGTQELSGTVTVTGVDDGGSERTLGSCELETLGANGEATVFASPEGTTFEADGIGYVMASVHLNQTNEELFKGTETWKGDLPTYSELEEPAGATELGWSYEDGAWVVKLEADNGAIGYKTGWHWDNGWYYLSPEGGEMLSGWLDEGGRRYWLNTRHDGHFGRMGTGWLFVEGEWYLAASSGALRYGWAWDNATKAWYYLNETDGRMLRDCATPDGERVDGTGRWVA